MFLFDWRFDIPEELIPYIRKDIHDFNNGWISSIDSNCGFDRPNHFEPLSESAVWICVWLIDIIPTDQFHLVDSIRLEFLAHPDCDLVVAETSFIAGQLSSTNKLTQKPISVFPNPVKSDLYIVDLPIQKYNYQILSLDGAIMQSGLLHGEEITFNFDEFGYFILKLQSKDQLFSSRFIKL